MSDTPERQEADRSADPTPEPTDAHPRAMLAARKAVYDLEALLALAEDEDPGWADGRLEDLGLSLEAGARLPDQADRLIDAMALAVDVLVTFEIVLGGGGSARRLRFECGVDLLDPGEFGRFPDADGFTTRRVFFHPWVGSAEVELHGEDRRVAEAFARRVVPELGS
jgi:hypothetical protein